MSQSVKVTKDNASTYSELSSEKIRNDVNFANNSRDKDSIRFEEICRKFPMTEIECNRLDSTLSLRKSYIGMYTTTVYINGMEATVMLDTGAENSVMSDGVLNALGTNWKKDDSIEVKSFNNTPEKLCVALVGQIKLGKMSILNLPVIVINQRRMRLRILNADIAKIDGIIGWDVLSRCNFELDYKHREFRIMSRGVSRGTEILNTSFPTILIDVQGELRPYGLDTGAKKSWISKSIVDKYGLEIVSTKNKSIYGAHGKEKTLIDVIRNHSVGFGDYKIEFRNIRTGFTTFLNNYELDGILGNDILRYHIFSVDNEEGICRLHK